MEPLPPLVIHEAPTDGSGLMPCCDRATLDADETVTTDPAAVTCRG